MVGERARRGRLHTLECRIRIDQLGDHPGRRIVDRHEGIGVLLGEIDAACGVVAVVGVAVACKGVERGAPCSVVGAGHVIEEPLHIAEPERIGDAGGCGTAGNHHLRQVARPGRRHQIKAAQHAQRDGADCGIGIGVAIDRCAIGQILHHPHDRHIRLLVEEGGVVGRDHEVLDHRGAGDRVEHQRGRDAACRAVIVDNVVAEEDFADMVNAGREHVGAVVAIQDRAGRRGWILHDQDPAFGVNEPDEQVARAENVRDVLGARGVTGFRAQQPRAVVAADDVKHRVSLRYVASIVDLERKDVVGTLALAE